MSTHLNSFDSIENYPKGTDDKDIQEIDYSKIKNKALTDLEEIALKKENQTEDKETKFVESKGESPDDLNKNKVPAHGPFIFNNYHNFFINFFKYMKELFKYNIVGGYDARTSEVSKILYSSYFRGSCIITTHYIIFK